jgi:CheY-like chemotaxis protein
MTTWARPIPPDVCASIQVATTLVRPIHGDGLARAFVWRARRVDATSDELVPARASAEFRRMRQRILLVEDNVVNQRVASRMLQRLGLQADVASNGVEAVSAVEAQEYALVLMDCQMPEMDGYQAAGAIRRLSTIARNVPIVAMTANAMQGDRERCLAAGMDDYMTKPLTLDALQGMLKNWIELVREARDAAAGRVARETEPS